MVSQSDIIILGAGIAGTALAYQLVEKYKQANIHLLDRGLPLSFTTSKSGENFRSYWPQPCMKELVKRSLHLMEKLAQESEQFELHYGGYEYVSERNSRCGTEEGVELLHEREIRTTRPYLAERIRSLRRIEQAGDFDVHGLGMLMLSKARQAGAICTQAEICSLSRQDDCYLLQAKDGREFQAPNLVLASGPFLSSHLGELGLTLPLECFLQQKIVLPDPLKLVPQDMPFTIYEDSQVLGWDEETKALLRQDPDYDWLLREFPGGLHIKPESGGQIKLGWAFNREPTKVHWHPRADENFARIVLLGASRFIPGLHDYFKRPPAPLVSYAGYYTRTKENWPIIGPLELPGLFVIGALSGFGTMAACAAGELCADWLANGKRQAYWKHFHPNRYEFPEIRDLLAGHQSDGQL